MKKLIRHNVYETNSSSCHSLTISNNTTLNDIPKPTQEGEIWVWSGEFGWERRSYNNFDAKASYIAVYIRDWSGDKKEDFRQLFEDVIKEATQCEEIVYQTGFWENKGWGNGYIDHQSVDSEDLHYLFEDTIQLEKFLFSSESELRTDNDNY